MTTTKIKLRDLVETMRLTLPENLHPAGATTIHHWFVEMIDAANHGDAETVHKFGRLVSEKVDKELQWERENTVTRQAPRRA